MSHRQCCTRHLIQCSYISFQCLINSLSCHLISNIDLKAKLQLNLLNIIVQFISRTPYRSLNNSSNHLQNSNIFHFDFDQLHLCLIRYKLCTIQQQNQSKTFHLELTKPVTCIIDIAPRFRPSEITNRSIILETRNLI